MTAYTLVIAPAARDDLREIYQYSRSRWGRAQSELYLDTLKGCLWRLGEHPFMGLERPELLPDVRSLVSQQHTLFYRVGKDRIELLRILHNRQDPNRQLDSTAKK